MRSWCLAALMGLCAIPVWSTTPDAGPAHESDPNSVPVFRFAVQDDHVVFTSTDPQGAAVWTTDGTPDGTRQLARFSNRIGSILPVGSAGARPRAVGAAAGAVDNE